MTGPGIGRAISHGFTGVRAMFSAVFAPEVVETPSPTLKTGNGESRSWVHIPRHPLFGIARFQRRHRIPGGLERIEMAIRSAGAIAGRLSPLRTAGSGFSMRAGLRTQPFPPAAGSRAPSPIPGRRRGMASPFSWGRPSTSCRLPMPQCRRIRTSLSSMWSGLARRSRCRQASAECSRPRSESPCGG